MKRWYLIQAVIGLFVALAIPTYLALAATVDQCQGAWDQCSAEATCNIESIDVGGSQDCSVVAKCRKVDPVAGIVYVLTCSDGSLDDIRNLHNCEGDLNIGSCPSNP